MSARPADNDALVCLREYAQIVADASSRGDVFRAAEQTAQTLIGHRLFSVMAFDANRMEVRRCFSSDPDNYPTGGRKKKRATDWGRHVLEEGRVFIGSGEGDIRRSFDDHEVIIGLGLYSVLNIPVKRLGKTVGTMNLLGRATPYDLSDASTGALIAMGLVGALELGFEHFPDQR